MRCLYKRNGLRRNQYCFVFHALKAQSFRYSSTTSKRNGKSTQSFFFHFSDPPFNLNTLTHRILNSGLLVSKPDKIEISESYENLLIDAINSCKALHLKTYSKGDQITSSRSQDTHDLKLALAQSKKFLTPLDLLTAILDYNASNLTYKSLLEYLVTRPYPPTQHVCLLLTQYRSDCLSRSGKYTKPILHNLRSLVYIALRRALLRQELELAYELIDVSNPTSLSAAGGGKRIPGETSNRHALLSVVSLASMGGGCIIIGSYLLALPPVVTLGAFLLLGASQIAFYLRAISWSSRVCWRPGILLPSLARIKYQHELKMIDRIAVGYDELIDLTVDNYHHLAAESSKSPNNSHNLRRLQKFQHHQLIKHKTRLIETDQELMFNEYWTRAGEGFAWVEPDQDPSDTLVRTIRERKACM